MAIERDSDDAVGAPGRRWQSFTPGIEVYTRDPAPPPGEPFTGNYEGSAFVEGRWRVYVGEGVDPVAEGFCEGRDGEERMAAAKREVERWWGGQGAHLAASDLDVWRTEAGEVARLDAAAPIGPWEFGERNGGFGRRWVATQNPNHCIIQLPEGAGPFIAAARTGWPRDAARVVVLADRCLVMEAALDEALAFLAHAVNYIEGGGGNDIDLPTRETIARLRALACAPSPRAQH